MHSLRFPNAGGPRLVLLMAIVAGVACMSCGGHSASIPLPPAIPAAEPVLLFTGVGTSSSDVAAVKDVLATLGLGYVTADSAQLNAMSEPQLAGYKLLIVPGGDSTVIGGNLSPNTTANLRGAVSDYGTHYLGICAGAFFGGYSIYNGVNLTGGVAFDFYADEFRGIHLEPVLISFPSGDPLDVYWQDGPQVSGWGKVVAKFPDGTAAIAEGTSGKGFVVLTGVHLEAPAGWRGSMNFTTPLAVDLAYAGTVVQAAYSGTPLSSF